MRPTFQQTSKDRSLLPGFHKNHGLIPWSDTSEKLDLEEDQVHAVSFIKPRLSSVAWYSYTAGFPEKGDET
jgi:hypothetical protein